MTLAVTLAVALILLIGGGAYYALVLAPPSQGYENVSDAVANGAQAQPVRTGFLCESDPALRRRSESACAASPAKCAGKIREALGSELPATTALTAARMPDKDGQPVWRLTATRQSRETTLYDYHPCSGALRELRVR